MTAHLILNAVGYLLFGVGALYALASHSLHDALPVFAGLPHSTHLWIGGGTLIVGVALLIAADRLTKTKRTA